jgi:aminoglycoside 3-N-acetyltransferase I
MPILPVTPALYHPMLALFGEAFGERDTYTGRPPSDAYVQALLANPDVIALVALEGDAVVGALVAYVLRKFEQERCEVYVYDLAVAEAHRRRGIATALMEEVRSIASARGASVIYVQADPEDAPAVALYTKLGRREDVLHFDIAPAHAP